ncbi:MAG: hypothetical protein LLF76_09045 [Planctomycetaceae bacterium]|nr:hypothetical protein [Planctomycetaceae bacterium]
MDELEQDSRTPAWCKVVLLAGMLLFGFYASTHMVAAGDTWVALACGRHFAQHGVDNVEPFSFNSHPAGPSDEQLARFPQWTHGIIRYWHPTGWINQNWLTHLTYYKLVSWFGTDGQYNYNTLVMWKFALYTVTVLVVFAIGKIIGAGDFLSAAGACLAMVVGRSFFDIRPAGYSNMLGPMFILVLALATYRNYKWIWLLVPLVVFWANVHGGYIYVFIMMVPFVGVHLLLLLPKRWTISLGAIGLWLVLYMMSYKFLTNDYYVQVQTYLNPQYKMPSIVSPFLATWLIIAAVSAGLAATKKSSPAVFYLYHVLAGFIFFAALLGRYFVQVPSNLTPQFKNLLNYQISSSLTAFIGLAAVAVLLISAMAFKKERFINLNGRGLMHTIGAGVAAFAAMVIFNPYHLTNLTHTFEISVSKHAESWRQVNEWKPAFDWMDKTATVPNPVGEEEWFGVMCILTAVVLAVWLIIYFMQPSRSVKGARKMTIRTAVESSGGFSWPKSDLAIVIISLLTIYMAVQSRRFIAMAGSVAAPAVFLLMRQACQMISARVQWQRANRLEPYQLGRLARQTGYLLLAFALACTGLYWGRKFYIIYVAPWPAENKYDSVFMRMTASHLKPFEICDFINQNELKGRVFNYWTEGGALAFGEKPDPKTGEIPLKLFMDGRAQAAYNHETFRLWQEIDSGGSLARDLMRQGKGPSQWKPEEAKPVGQWIDAQLKERNVWATLMPKSQDDSAIMVALKATPNWKTVYLDNTQHLLVDIESEPGKTLMQKVLEDTAIFPDAVSRSLTETAAIIENNYVQRSGDLFKLAKEGFEAFPYPSTALALTRISGVQGLRGAVTGELQKYVEQFQEKQAEYRNASGYLNRLASAEIAARYLAQRGNAAEAAKYLQLADRLRAQAADGSLNRIW